MPDSTDLRKHAAQSQAHARAVLQLGALLALVLAGLGVRALLTAPGLADGLSLLGLAAAVFIVAAYRAYTTRIYARVILLAVTTEDELVALTKSVRELRASIH